jgi:signal transduction histidine kinase
MNRVKWYHYYIALATFDVLVILGSLWLHHRTLGRFSELLNRAAVLDSQQRELTSLGLRLVALNSPGNRVFETGQVDAERLRYRRLRGDMDIQRRSGHIEADDLSDFWKEVDRMCLTEESIFGLMDLALTASDPADRAKSMVEAGRLMSAMDEHQANALKHLGREQEDTMNQTASMLMRHQQILLRQTEYEWVFVGALSLILAGIFWFFVKLQRTDEFINAERRERLAVIGELCSSVAHGIQNPLSAIHSSAELILDFGMIDGDSRRRAGNVLAECDLLSRRVTRLLKFAGTEEPVRLPIDVAESISDACRELQPVFEKNAVRVESPVESGCVIRAASDELATVLIELISNAIDHSPAGELITVSCRRDGRKIIIEVRDRGPGVLPQSALHIFDLFFTTKDHGTGIGLASVKRTVESLGGTIELVSPGSGERGSIFRVIVAESA